MNILLIENEPVTRLTIEQLLQILGYEVTTCGDTEAALDIYQQRFYPLILLDLEVPGTSSFEFCQRMRALPQGDRSLILAMTVMHRPEDLQNAFDVGADDYLIKPVSMKQLHPRLIILERELQHLIERKRMEEALQESEVRYRSLFENAVMGISQSFPNGHLICANTAYAQMYGYTNPEEMIAEVSDIGQQLYANPADRAEVLRILKTKGVMGPREIAVVRRDGTQFFVLVGAREVRDPKGNLYCYQAEHIDITDRKRAEEELKTSHEQLRNLSAHLQAIREEERTCIAREIHDELGQALTALKMDVSWLKKRFRKDQSALFDKALGMETLLDATIRTVRRLTTELRPGLLDDLGLSAAITWQAEEFQQRTGIPCEVTCDPDEIMFNEVLSTAVFRIFQEALTNVARHAQATHIQVLLKKDVNRLYLEIRDNGKGITMEQVADPKSFGLIGIRERVQFLGGQVTFQGKPNHGTTVTVSFPLI